MAEDARVRKTKEKLSNALVELLRENAFSDISPAWICEKAGINRSTFYRNYRNTTELKEEMERKIMDSVRWGDSDFDVVYSRKSIVKQLTFLKEKKDTFWALSCDSFKDSIFEKLSRKLIAEAQEQYDQSKCCMTKEAYNWNCVFYISGMVGLIVNWYENGMVQPIEEVADFILDKLVKGIKGQEAN